MAVLESLLFNCFKSVSWQFFLSPLKNSCVYSLFLLKECSFLQHKILQWKYISPFWLLRLAWQQEQRWSQTCELEAGNLKSHSGHHVPWTLTPQARPAGPCCRAVLAATTNRTGVLGTNVRCSKDGGSQCEEGGESNTFCFHILFSRNQKYQLPKWEAMKNDRPQKSGQERWDGEKKISVY